VIKSVDVARNDACEKWTTLKVAPFGSSPSPGNPREWTPTLTPPKGEDLASTDRVIVLSPGNTDANARTLINNGTIFWTTFGNVTSSPWPPTGSSETRIIYGINSSTASNPVRPFNRADYFIERPTTNMPTTCNPQTGILYKATMNHDSSGSYNYLPLLDCVADMQVIYALDNDENGDFVDGTGTPPDAYSDDITALTVQQIRTRVRQVRVYILAHEGQRDVEVNFNNFNGACSHCVLVGEFGLERNFDLATITDYQYYRWKLYTIVVTPNNLR
jgi:hypothetical protein